ncbi:lipase [Sphingomonas ginkgonis]|uniref:Lipase n=1 Tax=Sphingomonas ginkgonis TaxID=2315330 RepID=A0A3R9YMJ1_9SPHN|nr:alpha/beta fold hydrolase [Sphingomonas ginkgonis]RST30900.1 lipase [Sphingomonas ginkgonis]
MPPVRLAILALFLVFGSAAAAQRPGQLIASEPVSAAPAGMRAWRLRYWTRDGEGRPAAASAMLVAPTGAARAPRPLLAWTHGTWGVVSRCAPSLSPNFWIVTAGLDAVRRGYVVVAPDYPGLNGPGVHPFLSGTDTARSVLDSVRAAIAVPAAGAGRRFAVWGESQGGHAALWTAQEVRSYAPELTLLGAAAAAPPTDLVANLRETRNKAVRTFFLAYIGYSWSHRYGAPLATFGSRQDQVILSRLARNNCIELNSRPRLGTILGIGVLQRRWSRLDLGTVEPWAGLARTNSPALRSPGVPLLIAQNADDDLVAPAVTRRFARAQCRAGSAVKWIDIAGKGHATSAKDSSAATLAWLDRRFAGQPTETSCGRF